ncbi:MAG: hypothetical protein A3H49_11140 [Nitrospirae bacterium RIFCSPLOWO2_02_FULL_62_14]|nr:MAG: hypothetical protein A3H49_11140 [Nitrospirae bacterium RIFCSPLOWO2_02_FULL_62_14]
MLRAIPLDSILAAGYIENVMLTLSPKLRKKIEEGLKDIRAGRTTALADYINRRTKKLNACFLPICQPSTKPMCGEQTDCRRTY